MSGDMWSSPPLPQDAPSEAERAAFEPRELDDDEDEQEDDMAGVFDEDCPFCGAWFCDCDCDDEALPTAEDDDV